MATGQQPNEGRFTRGSSNFSRGAKEKRRLRALVPTTPGSEQYGPESTLANTIAQLYFWGDGTVSKSSSDTGTASDETAAGVRISAQADTGSGLDAQTGARVSSDSDTGAGADAQSLLVPVTDGDTGSGTETQTGVRTSSLSEQGSGVDSQSGARVSTETDSGSGLDAQSGARVSVQADTGSGIDDQAGARTSAETDTGAGAESESLLAGTVELTDSDSGVGVDGESLVIVGSDVDPPDRVDRTRRFGQGRFRRRIRTTVRMDVPVIARVRPRQEYTLVAPELVTDPRLDEDILLLLS